MDRASATRSTPVSTADPNRFTAGALVAMLLLTASWTWWAIQKGAYFPNIFNPGIVLLCAAFVLLLSSAPWRARLSLSRPARLAALSLVGLAAWTLASGLWSPSPDVSISDAQRVLAYLLSFALGAWLCNMLGRRMELALAPIVLAAGIVGVVTVFELLHSTDLRAMLNADGTLQFPLGYRNAAAAFFLIAAWPALSLAAYRGLDTRLRLLALTIAALCIELGALSQSRGSFIGVAFALVAYLVFSRERIRAVVWLIVAALPLLIVVPLASDIYEAAQSSGLGSTLEPMRSAGRGALLGLLVSAAVGATALAIEPRFPEFERPSWANRRTGWVAALLIFLIALFAFTVKEGNPITWAGDRFDQFEAGEPDLSESSNRFTFNAGSNRSDVWRVALEATGDDPLFGDGSGGFQYRYLRDRHSQTQVARDAHSFELEMLSELGIPGLALLTLALGGAGFGIMRSHKLGPGAATLSAGALTAAAYWIGHSSFDWFWSYPGITAPVFGLLGAACAPALLDTSPPAERGRPRLALGVAAAALAVSVIPAFLSSLYLDNAYAEFNSDLPAAYKDVSRAQSLNPFSDEPLLAEGAIANRSGDRERAIQAFDEAIRKRPEEWAGHYFLAQVYAKSGQTKLALSELDAAARLNPLSDQIGPLRAKIKR